MLNFRKGFVHSCYEVDCERKLSLQHVLKQNLLHHLPGLNLSQIQHRDKHRKIAQMIQNKV